MLYHFIFKNTARGWQSSTCKNVKNKKWKKNEENLNLLHRLALFFKYLLVCALHLLLPPVGMVFAQPLHEWHQLVIRSIQIPWGWGGIFPMVSCLPCPPPQPLSITWSWVCCICVHSTARKYFVVYVRIAYYAFLCPLRCKFMRTGVIYLFTSISPKLRRLSGKESLLSKYDFKLISVVLCFVFSLRYCSSKKSSHLLKITHYTNGRDGSAIQAVAIIGNPDRVNYFCATQCSWEQYFQY